MGPFSPFNWFRSHQGQARCRTALSSQSSLDAAVLEVSNTLGKDKADLALVFVSSHFASDLPRLLPLLQSHLKAEHWLGCIGGGVVGTGQDGQPHELEQTCGLSVTLLNLPGAVLQPFAVDTDTLPDLDGSNTQWHQWLGIDPDQLRSLVVLIDPSSGSINDFISGLDYAFPSAPCLGGIAAPHAAPHGSLLHDQEVASGVVGLAIGGDWTLEPAVAQGCKPIGPVFAIEKAERNVLLELSDGTSHDTPVACLQKVLAELDDQARDSVKDSLFLGVERQALLMGPNGSPEPRSAFLIRNLIGVDPRNGAIAVAERIRIGQNVQFHLREAEAACQEARQLLCDARECCDQPPLIGLLFACLGRGAGLFGRADGDVGIARSVIADLPVAGAFCNGEVGPLAGSTHLHGYTACWGLLCHSPLAMSEAESTTNA
ncbi:MAG: FIST N-terminal domain-containing protein [Synechococcus sp.]|nr:FIST N-terminal domain-containing protein [Synechococcus sp.]